MYPVYSLLLRDVLACLDQSHNGVGEDWYPRDPAEITGKLHSGFCKRGDVHSVGLG